MHKTIVGVLRGGPSSEYDVSLKTGQTVLRHLPAEKYAVRDIFIDRKGVWHVRGKEMEPARALDHVDVVFNALHGGYGEDGTLQHFLDTHGVRYTGSGALGSGIAMNKALAKRIIAPSSRQGRGKEGVVVAADSVLEGGVTAEAIADIYNRLTPPYVVKPANGGSSQGTSVVSTQDELVYALLTAFEHGERVLVEQFVRGREVTVAVVEDFRGEALYAFPPIEIRPTKSTYFDYAEKYDGHAQEVCPAPLPRETTRALLDAARHVHRTLGLRDYSRSDFILGSDGIYFLEVNTLPGLTPTSLVPKAVEAVGAKLPHFLDHLVSRALAR